MNIADNLPVKFEAEKCGAFLRHWLALRKTDLVPHCRTFLDGPPFALMPNVIIQEVTSLGLRVRFFGTDMVERWRRDITGSLMGAGFPPAAVERLCLNAAQIVSYPCGMHQIDEVASTMGRNVKFEAIVLPLAVDEGLAKRVVAYSHMLDHLRSEEGNDHFLHTSLNEWVDLGAGMPALPPFGQ